ncbi:hypothetical protein ACHAW5_005893 [Stephanodiscus triporus]|uniref:glutathione gamma-glutamylcysteinyltransferase n=1 Tax=Stephanodiscus triporus TaxID=2934178 RepID=A0ABD3NIG4_9STRA
MVVSRTFYRRRLPSTSISFSSPEGREVKETGITFGTFACLAKCQGLDVDAVYGSNSTVDDFRRIVKWTCTDPSSSLSSSPSSSERRRRHRPASFLVVSYTRKVIGQTGTGHFSPIGAYDEASDHVLVLDTARFKYGPHWIPLQLMFDALLPEDPDTGKSRGYMVLSYDGFEGGSSAEKNDAQSSCPLPLSVLFGSKKSKDFLRREYKHFLGGNAATLQSVVSFWTKNHSQDNFVWELVEPQLQPVDSADIELVDSVRRLLRSLIEADDHASGVISEDMMLTSSESAKYPGECCKNSHDSRGGSSAGRSLDISPGEVLYIIYLASLPPDARRNVVYKNSIDDDDDDARMARKQILDEAALISYAIETCDADV